MPNIINFQVSNTDINRARIERVLKLSASIMGYNPDYISLIADVKPQDYVDGNPQGFYLRSVEGELYIQPVIWNEEFTVWENIGPMLATNTNLENRINALDSAIQDKKYIQSDVGEVTSQPRITNMIQLTQAEYDAIATPDASTVYIIVGG